MTETQKLLFLDIQGVLTTDDFHQARNDYHEVSVDFDPVCVLHLYRVIRSYDFRDGNYKLVINSNMVTRWQHLHAIRESLERAGFPEEEIPPMDATGLHLDTSRVRMKRERVNKYLQRRYVAARPWDDYIIVDDTTTEYRVTHDPLIEVDPEYGFRDRHVRQIEKHWGKIDRSMEYEMRDIRFVESFHGKERLYTI